MRQLLFHGTPVIDKIVNPENVGFLPSMFGARVGAIYGKGTYFARDAKYSDDYAHVLPSGEKQLIVADVALGTWTQGAKDKDCPELPGGSGKRYNSMVDNTTRPSIFVVQLSPQAYPAYVITYGPYRAPPKEAARPTPQQRMTTPHLPTRRPAAAGSSAGTTKRYFKF